MKQIALKKVAKYLICFSLFILINNGLFDIHLGLAVYYALLTVDFAILPTSFFYVFSCGYPFNLANVCFAFAECVITCTFVYFYKRKNKTPRLEACIYLLIAFLPYLLYGGVTVQKAVYTSVAVTFSLIAPVAVKVVFINGFRFKMTKEEIFSLALFISVIGVGTINLAGYYVWKAISVFLILFACYIYADGTSLVVAGVVSVAPCIVFKDFTYCGLYVFLALIILSGGGQNKLVSAISVIICELLLYFFTDVFVYYSVTQLIFVLTACVIFAFIPKRVTDYTAEQFFKFRQKRLPKLAINRVRTGISSKLYEVSCAFAETYNAVSSLKKMVLSSQDATKLIAQDVINSVCFTCPMKLTCMQKNFPPIPVLERFATVGLAKGKITLVDVPSDFTAGCPFFSGVLANVNKNLQKYKEKIKISKTFNDENELVCLQTKAVSAILKEFALNYDKKLVFLDERENAIIKQLHKNGILVNEVLVYGSGINTEISLVLDRKNGDAKLIANIISNAISCKTQQIRVILTQAVNLTQTLVSLTYGIAPMLDATFGVAQKCKNGNTVCGDAHSFIKLSVGKFVVAVNDGMGSGEKANKISNLTTTLIESFFKAGLGSEVVLKTVNKIISVCDEETFSALDLAIVDLYCGAVDFIKIGSPYGYVLNKNEIKIIEASSLPLGIAEDVSPVSGSTALSDGDVIVLLSDGVSDAFGSSAEIIEYLKNVNCLNPQVFAQTILNKALALDPLPSDDMTVLCVKIFNKYFN